MAYQNLNITGIPAPQPKDYDPLPIVRKAGRIQPEDLNANFQDIEQAVDETQARLRLIQRDDGALANQSVGFDQLADETLVGIRPPVEWVSGNAYAEFDTVVIDGTGLYVALESHTAGPSFQDDLSSGLWRLIFDISPVAIEDYEVTTSTGTQLVPDALDDRVNKSEVGAESVTTATGSQALTAALDDRTIPLNSVAVMKALGGLKVGQHVRTLGYYTPGDGGGNDYEIVAAGTGTDDGGSFIDLGGSSLQAKALFPAGVLTKHFGVMGDGATQDYTKLAAARAYAASASKELVFLPGTYRVNQALAPAQGERWRGVSKAEVTLFLDAGVNDHLVKLSGDVSFELRDMTLDANRANQTAGHGIRFGGTDGVVIKNVHIQSPYAYGIGMQAGANRNVTISRFSCDDAGRDGIDVKDYDLANENIVLDDIYISDFGQTVSQQSAVDIRGPVELSNLRVKGGGSEAKAFRLRGGSVQGREGSGVIRGIRYVNSGAGTAAVQISDNVGRYSITGVYCQNAEYIAIFGAGSSGVMSNIAAVDIQQDAFSIAGNGVKISNVDIEGCLRLADIESGAAGNTISHFKASGITSSEWARTQASTGSTVFDNGTVTSGKSLNDSGTDTVVRDVRNYVTRFKTLTDDLLVDTTGTKTFSVSHSLAKAPALEDVSLTLIRSTGQPGDYAIRFLHVDNVDAASITGRIYVDRASATSGAAVKVAIKASIYDTL